MFSPRKRVNTKDLSGAAYSVTASAHGRLGFWRILAVLVLLSGGVYAMLPPDVYKEESLQSSVDGLKLENHKLVNDLSEQNMSLQHEQATREALERQLAAQTEELKKARKDLSFYRENTARQAQ